MSVADRLDVQRVCAAIGDGLLAVKETHGETFLCVTRESLRDAVVALKEDPELDYAYFAECLGVDYLDWEFERDFRERFEVVYNLYSLRLRARLFLKVGVDDGQTVPSLKDLYLGAEYPEREVWDLFGILFEGNEQTQRFLMPDDWVGWPLRKDVPLGGEDVVFDQATLGPAVEDVSMPHAGESFEGKTGSEDVGGR